MADLTIDQIIDYLISQVATQKSEPTDQQSAEEPTKDEPAPMEFEKDENHSAPPPSPQDSGYIYNFKKAIGKLALPKAGKEENEPSQASQNIFAITLEVIIKIDKQ